MVVLRRPLPARMILICCALLFLVHHFSMWNSNYKLAPASPVSVQNSEVPKKPQKQQPPSPQELHGIPKKIWYKLGPRSLNDDTRRCTETCITQNLQYHVEFLTDQSADDFVKDKFADRPDIVETYLALTVPILKADLIRYLLLFAEGGVWFDLDVWCEGIPIDEWIPEEFREGANLVVGWEFDAGFDFVFRRQFTTWTVLARKGVGHLMTVVNDIVRSMADVAKAHNVTVAGLTMDMVGDIIEFTGPRRFKRSVSKSLKRSLGKTFGWADYFEILEPKMVGDVVIFPGYALSAEVSRYLEKYQDMVGLCLVTHHFAGSWKNKYGGELAEEGSQRA